MGTKQNTTNNDICSDTQKAFGECSTEDDSLAFGISISDWKYCSPFCEELFLHNGQRAKFLEELGDNYYMVYFTSSEKTVEDNFNAYYNSLLNVGMMVIEEPRCIMNNENAHYASLEKDGWVYTLVGTLNNAQMRVFIEKKEQNPYFSYTNENSQALCEPLFIQIGSGIPSAMCYVFRFTNGEFLVIDGGMNDDNSEYSSLRNSTRLLETLKQYAPDPSNVTVVAWLITHPHIDHIGVLDYYCSHYSEYPEIKIKNILWNNYSNAVLSEKSSADLVAKVSAYRAQINKLTKIGTKVHCTHIGQKLSFGNSTLEIIYTHELRMGYEELINTNALSIVLRVTVKGQTFLITGDTSTHANQVMEAIFGDSLKSDFYQTPHHGWGKNTLTLAETVNPRWVLWPCNTERYEIVRGKEHNRFLFSDTSRVEAHYIADNKTFVFSLPFDGVNMTITENQ